MDLPIKEIEKFLGKKIISVDICKGGLANEVYKIATNEKVYILKKYLYDYNFFLSKELYELYEKEKINCIKPINIELLNYNGYNYNLFPYLYEDEYYINQDEFILKILSSKFKSFEAKEIKKEYTLNNKIEKYIEFIYNYLKKANKNEKIIEEIKYVINTYLDICNSKNINFKKLYINHGDIQPSNIIQSGGELYLIDFDEACYSNELYDFSVVFIKCYYKKENEKKFVSSFLEINNKFNNEDLLEAVRYYLCKILIEKFYLYFSKKIDLFSGEQKTDSYLKYLNMLKKIKYIS